MRAFASFEAEFPTDGTPPLLRRWTQAIHEAIWTDSRFRSIRWYDREQFDRDHGETYLDRPSEPG